MRARAVACAVAMQAAIVDLNERNAAEGLPHLEMGVAVHTGEVIVGNIGSERRTKYGVVGSAVNHAGRIESFTVGGQVLISEATLREAGGRVHVGARLTDRRQGHPRADRGVRPERRRRGWACRTRPRRSWPSPSPSGPCATWSKGSGSRPRPSGRELIELSTHGASVVSPRRLRPLSNLKLELRPPGGTPVEIYAKVVSVAPGGSVIVRFTSLPTEVERWLRELVADGPPPSASDPAQPRAAHRRSRSMIAVPSPCSSHGSATIASRPRASRRRRAAKSRAAAVVGLPSGARTSTAA